jgi:6-phosphogluconolactonase
MLRITDFANRDALMAAAAFHIVDALQAGIAARGQACAALSGGSAEGAYLHLAQAPLDWPRITLALVDERFVPPDHAASNEGMLRSALAPALRHGATLAPMYAPTSLDDAATRAEALYASLHIDIAIMGMGSDGHTASWFPGSEQLSGALDARSPHTVIAARAPNAAGATERLTLTLPALARAERVLLLISGDEKRAVLERAVRDKDAPVAALFTPPLNAEVLWAP